MAAASPLATDGSRAVRRGTYACRPMDQLDEYEEVDALPVLSGPGEAPPPVPDVAPRPSRSLRARVGGDVVVQAAAVATAGFAVGAATVAVAKRYRRAPVKRRVGPPRGGLDIAATKRFVIDVHELRP